MSIDPHAVFRWLPRAERAAYAAAMHETLAGRLRDLDRAASRLGGVAGAAVRADVARLREHARGVSG